MNDKMIEVVFSFDTTGSMYHCLTELRKTLGSTIDRLFNDLPNLRIGLIAHGDYCDLKDNYGPSTGKLFPATYLIKTHTLSTNKQSLMTFVDGVEKTYGGDNEEAYEFALKTAGEFNWMQGSDKVFVLIGDDNPHPVSQNPDKLDWRKELEKLTNQGVRVFGLHALASQRQHAKPFYEEIAQKTGGFYLSLDQFSNITDTILAIVYSQAGKVYMDAFDQELKKSGRLTRSMDITVSTLSGRKLTVDAKPEDGLVAVDPTRFQVCYIPNDIQIDEYAKQMGFNFAPGRGFYELTKAVKVQAHKEVVLVNKVTGDMYTGKTARKLLNLPDSSEVSLIPRKLPKSVTDKYKIFVQSTSYNRKLLAGTQFLYETRGNW